MTNPRINPARLALSILAVFIVVTGTDYLVHQILLSADYKATPSTWRPEAEMMSNMWAMMVSHLLIAVAATLLYARIAVDACLKCAVIYGFCYGLFFIAGHLMSYFVYNVPSSILIKWIIFGLIQGILLGLTAYFVYKPAKLG